MASREPVVLRTAATPAEALVLVARLKSEGIQAHVEGSSLVDEVAMSRRAMNLHGVRVVVPANSIWRARAVLASARVDDAELTAQALAERLDDDGPALAPVFRMPRPRRGAPTLLLVLATLAIVGLVAEWLW